VKLRLFFSDDVNIGAKKCGIILADFQGFKNFEGLSCGPSNGLLCLFWPIAMILDEKVSLRL
jgi:hypothetical protein